MTCDRFKDRVGYRGQRYEHSIFDADAGARRVLGWSNTENDLAFVNMTKRPGWSQYKCREMSAEERDQAAGQSRHNRL